MTDKGPVNEICLSVIFIMAFPSSPAITFPKSPACLTSSVGLPWVLPCGLKWPPELVQPRKKRITVYLTHTRHPA